MSKKIDVQPVKGTRDFYPEDMRLRRWLFNQWHAVAAQYGFEEYDSCILESEELYLRKAGDEISSQLYNFSDKGDRRVALRPEMTPSLARMVMAKAGNLGLPLRWYSLPQCFRYERQQRGRKREHFQWNMDIIGLDSLAAEVELMSAQCAFLSRVGLEPGKDVEIRVSNRQVIQGFLEELGITGEKFGEICVIIDKCDKIGPEATAELLQGAGISEEISQKILALMNVRGIEALGELVGLENPGYCALKELLELAAASGIADAVRIDASIIRGLSYYTGTVWECFDCGGKVPRAIAGGGRYDALIEHLGGKPTPMVGFGFGDVVILLILEERGLLPAVEALVDDVVYPMKAGQFVLANTIACKLRVAGRRVLVDYSERRFKHVIKMAEQRGAERMYILGESEVAAGQVTVRDLGESKEERKEDLAQWTDA